MKFLSLALLVFVVVSSASPSQAQCISDWAAHVAQCRQARQASFEQIMSTLYVCRRNNTGGDAGLEECRANYDRDIETIDGILYWCEQPSNLCTDG